jgi:hypothetical protein
MRVGCDVDRTPVKRSSMPDGNVTRDARGNIEMQSANRTAIPRRSTVGWGGGADDGRANHCITESSAPAKLGSSLGFDPLTGGFRAQSLDGNGFEIVDQWIEVVPTDQVAAVAVKYDPSTGRQIAPCSWPHGCRSFP